MLFLYLTALSISIAIYLKDPLQEYFSSLFSHEFISFLLGSGFFIVFLLSLAISLSLRNAGIFSAKQKLKKSAQAVKLKPLSVPGILTLFAIFFLILNVLIYRDLNKGGKNLLANIITQDISYHRYPITGLTGIVASAIQQKGDRLHFDLQVETVLRSNLEIPAKGLLRIYSFNFYRLADNPPGNPNRKFSHLGQIKPGSRLFILSKPLPLQSRYGEFNPFFNYLAEQGYDGYLSIHYKNNLDILDQKGSENTILRVQKWLANFRNAIWKDMLDYYSPNSASLMRAMLFGDAGFIDDDLKKTFQSSGTVHLLAASGLHLTLLFSIVFAVARLFVKNRLIFFLLTIAVGAFYLGLAGFKVSLLRAYLLALLSQSSFLLNRRNIPGYSLALVYIVLLLANHRNLFHLGFQLSFAAVFGIIFLYPILIQGWNKIQNSSGKDLRAPRDNTVKTVMARSIDFLVQSMLLSFSAGFFIMPLLWFRLGEFQPLSVLFNLLAVPLGSLYLFLSFPALLLLEIFSFLPNSLLFFMNFFKGWLDFLYPLFSLSVLLMGSIQNLKYADENIFSSLTLFLIPYLPMIGIYYLVQKYQKYANFLNFENRPKSIVKSDKSSLSHKFLSIDFHSLMRARSFLILFFVFLLVSPFLQIFLYPTIQSLLRNSPEKQSIFSSDSVYLVNTNSELELTLVSQSKRKDTGEKILLQRLDHIFVGTNRDRKQLELPISYWIIPQASPQYLSYLDSSISSSHSSLDLLRPSDKNISKLKAIIFLDYFSNRFLLNSFMQRIFENNPKIKFYFLRKKEERNPLPQDFSISFFHDIRLEKRRLEQSEAHSTHKSEGYISINGRIVDTNHSKFFIFNFNLANGYTLNRIWPAANSVKRLNSNSHPQLLSFDPSGKIPKLDESKNFLWISHNHLLRHFHTRYFSIHSKDKQKKKNKKLRSLNKIIYSGFESIDLMEKFYGKGVCFSKSLFPLRSLDSLLNGCQQKIAY